MPHPAAAEYWNEVAARWRRRGPEGAWRMVSDAINGELVDRWLPSNPTGSVLKTDLFDEVVGVGLVPRLSERFGSVTGIDLSGVVVDTARARHPQMKAVVADVRQLPFRDRSFDAVVSNSTLDHFPSIDDLTVALGELQRVLRPGAALLVTLDNPTNPVIAVRNALPERVRASSGLVPFAVGATCSSPRLRALLEQAGFDVRALTATFHFPRALAVLLGRPIDHYGSVAAKRQYVRLVTAFESLADIPTRFLTGYFVAALGVKR